MIDVDETVFSDCGLFRYTLRRDFLTGTAKVVFVMLNPSTADVQFNDATTRRAINFAHRLDCGGYLAVNLFALRSKDPKLLRAANDPVGPLNDEYLLAAAAWADKIVVAWGGGGKYLGRDKVVLELLKPYRLWCLGRTKHGHPSFPLYLRTDTEFEIFRDTR